MDEPPRSSTTSPDPDSAASGGASTGVRKLFGVQYLRAAAASGVAVYHVAPHFGRGFPNGAAGVDLFFVISGFLMVAVTSRETRALAFIGDRIRRIVPVYWIATSVMLVGGLAGLFPAMRLGGWHVIASYLFLPAVSPSDGKVWPLLVPGWTLNYEMAFYAVFALLLLLRRPVVALTLLTALFGGLALLGATLPIAGTAARFYTDGIIVEFVIGCWIGLAWKRAGEWPGILGLPLLIVALGLLGVALSAGAMSPRLVRAGLPLAGVLIAVLAIERRRPIARIAPLALIGDASYSIYIWHGLAISIALAALGRLQLEGDVGLVATLVFAVLAGIASYRVLERPLIAHFRRRRDAARTADPIGKGVTIAPPSASGSASHP